MFGSIPWDEEPPPFLPRDEPQWEPFEGGSVAVFGQELFPRGAAAQVAEIAGLAPGPELGRLLASVDLGGLTENQALDVVAAYDRQAGYEAARRHEALAALQSLPLDDMARDVAPDALAAVGPSKWPDLSQYCRVMELAARLGVSTATAQRRISVSTQLASTGRLAATGALLANGQLSEMNARLVAQRLGAVDDAMAADIEAAIMPLLPQMGWARLDNVLRREVIARRPVEEELAHSTARRERRVSRPSVQPAGMASMGLYGPAEDITLLWTALDAMGAKNRRELAEAQKHAQADGLPDLALTDPAFTEPEPIDALRFDALIGLACRVLEDPDLPERHGRRPAIAVTIAMSTLLDLDDHPADLEGYGPITADAARRVAADPTATWRRILTDPAGRMLDYGTTTYRPPQDLADRVIARDRTCMFPGCTRPARVSDLDHRVPFPYGPTSEMNMNALCERDHLVKTLGLWSYTCDADTGEAHWTDRHGRTVTRPAATYISRPVPALAQMATSTHIASSVDDGADVAANDEDDDLPPY